MGALNKSMLAVLGRQVQFIDASFNTTNGVPPVAPAGILQYDALVAVIIQQAGTLPLAPAGWTDFTSTILFSSGSLTVMYKIADGTESGTSIPFQSGGVGVFMVSLLVYRGNRRTGSPLGAVTAAQVAPGAPRSFVTGNSSGSRKIGCACATSAATALYTAPVGYTNRVSARPGGTSCAQTIADSIAANGTFLETPAETTIMAGFEVLAL